MKGNIISFIGVKCDFAFKHPCADYSELIQGARRAEPDAARYLKSHLFLGGGGFPDLPVKIEG